MKKLLSFSLILITLLTLSINTYATEQQTKLKVNAVQYNKEYKVYELQLIDINESRTGQLDCWIIDLLPSNKENKAITKRLNKLLYNKIVNVTFDDMNTQSIYDDIITEWNIEE